MSDRKIIFIQTERANIKDFQDAINILCRELPDYIVAILPLDDKIMTKREVIAMLEVLKDEK